MPISPPPTSTSSSHHLTTRWSPHSSIIDFDINMATIVVLLVLATIFAFAIHALLPFLLRLYQRLRPSTTTTSSSSSQKPQTPSNPNLADSLPSLVFTSGTKLAGGAETAPECAICLSEFAEGERVRVMPACNHGFHVKCVEAWLVTKSSCPTCRTSCRPVAEEP